MLSPIGTRFEFDKIKIALLPPWMASAEEVESAKIKIFDVETDENLSEKYDIIFADSRRGYFITRVFYGSVKFYQREIRIEKPKEFYVSVFSTDERPLVDDIQTINWWEYPSVEYSMRLRKEFQEYIKGFRPSDELLKLKK